VATDAVVTLWEGFRSLLEGAIGAQDTGAEQAAKVIKSDTKGLIESNAA